VLLQQWLPACLDRLLLLPAEAHNSRQKVAAGEAVTA
jgi:hypothetical protein